MIIETVGVLKEIKVGEHRVGLRPQDVEFLINENGCTVNVECDAGAKCGYTNYDYMAAGARVLKGANHVYEASDLIVKVKEPQPNEYIYFSSNKIFFCYFHFAASSALKHNAELSGAICLPYEELELPDGSLPLLFPMSEIAGKIGTQKGAEILANQGVLIGGATGVAPALVVIIGGGVVGYNAAKVADGMGAQVIILDRNVKRLTELNSLIPTAQILYSNQTNLNDALRRADLIIGSVHSKGKRTDRLVGEEQFKIMKKGSVFVDVAIDQGGCTSASKPTTHSSPTYKHRNTIMYCVANMPALTARTSTHALCNSSVKYISELLSVGTLSQYYKE